MTMLSKKLAKAINDQIQAEIYSSYLYLSMSNYCTFRNLKGFAKWMKLQSSEETEHATKFIDYVLQRGEEVTLEAIEAPPRDFGTPHSLFEQVLKHEQKVTGLITKLYELSLAEKDYPTQSLLKWYIDEQVEEEATAAEIVGKLAMVSDKSSAVLYIDKELGKRGTQK